MTRRTSHELAINQSSTDTIARVARRLSSQLGIVEQF